MGKTAIFILIALIVASSVGASGVLITAQTKEAGFNDAAYYAYHAGDLDLAEQLYLAAIDEKPSYERARYNLATLYFEEGRYDEAITQLETLTTMAPNNANYKFDLAVDMVESMKGRGTVQLAEFDRAIALYHEADVLSPGFPHAAENAAVLERIRAQFLA